MKFDPQKHQRRSIRLPEYDYKQPGSYCLTLCAWRRECLFGVISDDQMQLSQVGKIVREEWHRSAQIRQEIELDLDEFVIMPNHIHGVVQIINPVGADAIRLYGGRGGRWGRSWQGLRRRLRLAPGVNWISRGYGSVIITSILFATKRTTNASGSISKPIPCAGWKTSYTRRHHLTLLIENEHVQQIHPHGCNSPCRTQLSRYVYYCGQILLRTPALTSLQVVARRGGGAYEPENTLHLYPGIEEKLLQALEQSAYLDQTVIQNVCSEGYFFQQLPGCDQVGRVKSFGEPVIDPG